jgi:polyphosphate glucokinase
VNRRPLRRRRHAITLAIDIGGTGLKALLLDESGNPRTERARVDTPRPATPDAVVAALLDLVRDLGRYDRISVGFPGVVIDGTVRSAPNLDGDWNGYPLAHVLAMRLERPARVLNDAGVQGYGVIEGTGVEMVLTLGTGMGTALYLDGHYVPNIELGHHPFGGGRTYEQHVGRRALKRLGRRRWNKHVRGVLEMLDRVYNPRKIYIGGGNAKYVSLDLPEHVSIKGNVAGLLGGIALWREALH